MLLRSILAAAALALASGDAVSPPADGELVASAPCERKEQTYDEYVAFQVKAYKDEGALGAQAGGPTRPPVEALIRALPTREEYAAQEAKPTACRVVTYGSDGLKVKAFIWEPATIAPGTHLPVIVALRGGNGDLGKFTPDNRRGMWTEVEAGFVVVGVQYRGTDGGEGADQFGGDDVHDVLNALKLAARLPEADTRNLFLEGFSRGGMMVPLALEQGAHVNAAAMVSSFTDLDLERRERPAMAVNVWSKLIPGYAGHEREKLESRSGVRVAKSVDLPPILLLHGTADWRADPANSVEVADALKARGRPYELHLFEGDVHGLLINARERDRLLIGWYRSHVAP
jgi:dipeptidyl aminopeptidase/acylaminoacyl peptidase